MISFRTEQAGEAPHIFDLVRKTYGQDAEALLVEDLCANGDALVSIVAIDDDNDDENELVGHAMFSDTPVGTTHNLLRGAALAPLSVSVLHQNQGIGGGLVIEGLRQCRKMGIQVVLVLGDPDYYTRFGFSLELAKNLTSPYSGDAYQAIELQPGILDGVKGSVLYPDAFQKLE